MEPYFVLIIEDDALRVDHLVRLLQKNASKLTGQSDRQLSIRTAGNQREADQALTEAPPRGYDLVILDRKYPSDAGQEVAFLGDDWLPKLRDEQPNATIAIATAFASEEFMEKAVEALSDYGADEFIPKTVDEDETISRLIKAIGRRRLKSQSRMPHVSNVLRVSSEDLHLAFSKTRARLRSLGAGEIIEELFRELEDSVERISGRFQGPLSPEEKDLMDVDLLRVVNEELPFFEGQLPSWRIHLETDGSHRVRTYAADFRDALREVMQNAVDATAEEDSKATGPMSVIIGRSASLGFTEVQVSDQGSGFNDEALDKMYQPGYSFWKYDGKRHKGMGLYVARRMMQAIGGDIRYEKPLGKGATIILSVRDWGSQ